MQKLFLIALSVLAFAVIPEAGQAKRKVRGISWRQPISVSRQIIAAKRTAKRRTTPARVSDECGRISRRSCHLSHRQQEYG